MSNACRTICLLELEEPLERVVRLHLDRDGYRAVRGDSLAAVATAEPAPAAVVVDFDALDPAEWSQDSAWLTRCRERGPLLILTSDRIPPRRERALGNAAILYKPFSVGELRRRLAGTVGLPGSGHCPGAAA